MNIDLPQVRRRRAPSGPVIHPEDAPNLVADWRSLLAEHIPLPLISASLSLVGVKKTRIVGRHVERDRLWTALHEVSHSGYPRAVILKGAAGNGKQRLAQWVAQSAHEAGMAQILSAEHGAIPSPAHGLPRMFAQLLHTRDLHGAEVLERTSEMLQRLGIDDPFEAQSLSRILLATSGAVSSQTTVSTGALSERLALYERLVQRMTDHRPIVIVIKNAQWAAEALQFANRLMRNRGSELPVLLVMTCDDEHLLQRQHELRQIEHLAAMPTCETIEVGPLPDEDASSLIEDLLRVDPRLAREIARRSEGSPLFAIQMVEDLVERGLLQAAPLGFRLKDSARVSLPPTVHALWKRRLDVTLDAMQPTARSAVLVGAALGVTVEVSEWEAACAALDIEIPSTLLTRLARANLIDVLDSGWAFTHGLLRECIAQEHNEGWSSINLACANMLDRSPASAGKAGRIGQHLLAAGRLQESLPFLRDGAKQAQKSGVFDDALSLLDHHQKALQSLSIEQTDERWGQQWRQQLVVLYNLRRFDRAQPLALKLCEAALEHNWTALLPIAFRWRGLLATANNAFEEALELFARAEALLGENQEMQHAMILRHWAELLRRIGRADESRQKLTMAAEIFERLDEHSELAFTRYHQAALQNVLFQDHARALELLEEAQQLHTHQGDNMGVADCWNGIAEIHRAKGNLADAEVAYQQSERFFSRAGIGTEIIPKLNRGLLQLQRNQFEGAKELLLDVQLGLAHGSWGALMPCVHAGLMVCAASKADWETWEDHETQLRSALEKSPMVERDLAEPLERAADLAQVEGQTDYAVRTWQLAQEQWRAIGDEEAVARLERRINSHLSKKNS